MICWSHLHKACCTRGIEQWRGCTVQDLRCQAALQMCMPGPLAMQAGAHPLQQPQIASVTRQPLNLLQSTLAPSVPQMHVLTDSHDRHSSPSQPLSRQRLSLGPSQAMLSRRAQRGWVTIWKQVLQICLSANQSNRNSLKCCQASRASQKASSSNSKSSNRMRNSKEQAPSVMRTCSQSKVYILTNLITVLNPFHPVRENLITSE